jgi:formamidopyrimidine-DNA glycosylase
MTGSFCVRGVAAPRYKAFSVDDASWPPRFHKLLLRLSDGGALAFCDARRFARLRLTHDPPAEAPISELGWDPLLTPPPQGVFAAQLARRSGPIKAALLDQALAAGVGNWVADEALYAARLHPETPACVVGADAAAAAALQAAVVGVCAAAVAVDADSARFPTEWLFHRRWFKKAGHCAEGHPLAFATVGGRTTCFVPAVQKKMTRGTAGGAEGAAPAPKKAGKRAAGAAAAAGAGAGAEAEAEEAAAAAAPKRRRAPAKQAPPAGAAAGAAAAAAAPPPPSRRAPRGGAAAAASVARAAVAVVAATARRAPGRLRAL